MVNCDADFVGDAAATRAAGVADGVRVHHLRVNVLGGNAQSFGQHHRRTGPAAADVCGAFDQVNCTVWVDIGGHTAGASSVEPETGSHAASLLFAFDSRIVGVVDGGFHCLGIADALVDRAVWSPIAFLGRVLMAEFERVHTDLLSQLVDDRFRGKGGVCAARRTVGAGLGAVHHNVVAVDAQVVQFVGGEDDTRARAHRRTGIGPGLVIKLGLGRGDCAILRRAHLHPDKGAGGGAGGLQDFRAGHHNFDRAVAALAGEQRGGNIRVGRKFAAESAADFRGCYPNLGNGQLQQFSHRIPNLERTLGGSPDVNVVVIFPDGSGSLGFDVALMDHRRAEFPLHNYIGRGKTSGQVAPFVAQQGGQIGGLVTLFAHRSGAQTGQQNGCARLGRFVGIQHRGQQFILDFDQFERFFGHMDAVGSHRGNGVAVVEHFVLGQNVGAQVHQIGHVLAHLLHFVFGWGQVFAGDNRCDAGERFSFAGVNAQNTGVGVGAAQNLAIEQAGQLGIRTVAGRAGHFVHPVVADRTGSDHFVVWGLGLNGH